MSRNYLYIILILFIVICGCQNQKPVQLSKVDEYFHNKLFKEKLSDNFEEDSEFGYIKIGNFLDLHKKNAVIISFDSITNFIVYELQNDEWEQIYQQKNVDFSRINGCKAYIEDYNFDGIKDIGILNGISNGTAIMTFHLWLSKEKTFQHIADFKTIGNPKILKQEKIIQGFEACCVFTEISLSDYKWDNFNLVKTHELAIFNQPYGVDAILRNSQKRIEKKIKLSQNDISIIINEYSENWKLVDTTFNSRFSNLKNL